MTLSPARINAETDSQLLYVVWWMTARVKCSLCHCTTMRMWVCSPGKHFLCDVCRSRTHHAVCSIRACDSTHIHEDITWGLFVDQVRSCDSRILCMHHCDHCGVVFIGQSGKTPLSHQLSCLARPLTRVTKFTILLPNEEPPPHCLQTPVYAINAVNLRVPSFPYSICVKDRANRVALRITFYNKQTCKCHVVFSFVHNFAVCVAAPLYLCVFNVPLPGTAYDAVAVSTLDRRVPQAIGVWDMDHWQSEFPVNTVPPRMSPVTVDGTTFSLMLPDGKQEFAAHLNARTCDVACDAPLGDWSRLFADTYALAIFVDENGLLSQAFTLHSVVNQYIIIQIGDITYSVFALTRACHPCAICTSYKSDTAALDLTASVTEVVASSKSRPPCSVLQRFRSLWQSPIALFTALEVHYDFALQRAPLDHILVAKLQLVLATLATAEHSNHKVPSFVVIIDEIYYIVVTNAETLIGICPFCGRTAGSVIKMRGSCLPDDCDIMQGVVMDYRDGALVPTSNTLHTLQIINRHRDIAKLVDKRAFVSLASNIKTPDLSPTSVYHAAPLDAAVVSRLLNEVSRTGPICPTVLLRNSYRQRDEKQRRRSIIGTNPSVTKSAFTYVSRVHKHSC